MRAENSTKSAHCENRFEISLTSMITSDTIYEENVYFKSQG